jgi:hypothetical protein
MGIAWLILFVIIAAIVKAGKRPSMEVTIAPPHDDFTVVPPDLLNVFCDPSCGCLYRQTKDGTSRRVKWCEECWQREKRLRKMGRRG